MVTVTALLLAARAWCDPYPVTLSFTVAPSATIIFQEQALAFSRVVRRCWKPKFPTSQRNVNALVDATVWVCGQKWSADPSRWYATMFCLAWSEFGGKNGVQPIDPSAGYWGVTYEVARGYASALHLSLPKRDARLRDWILDHPREAGLIAASEFMDRLEQSGGNVERAVLRYKLGSAGDLRGHAARVRREHWRAILHSYRNVAGQVANEAEPTCRCLAP